MARTFQITEIFPELTVRENIRIPVEIAAGLRFSPRMPRHLQAPIRDRIDQLLDEGGLHRIADRLAGELSHGDQRACEIMMSLALNPRLLLLDEPTEGLAPVIIQQIGMTIRALKEQGFTILLVEQNFRFAATVADRYYVMENGRIIDQFATVELDANLEKLHDYLGV
jgi:branched-chain amino acid transport system ATP-binding protein